jgi:IS30 family transposase
MQYLRKRRVQLGSYQHLSLVERVKIKTLQLQNFSLRAIGKALGRSHTTVSRELERNHQGHPMMSGYVPELANALSTNRKSNASQRPRLKCEAARQFVQDKLALRWTPEQISATIRNELPHVSLSFEAIYQYIYSDYQEGIKFLARHNKQRYPRNYSKKSRAPKIKNRVDIDARPEAINHRQVFGHWESDSIVSRDGKSAINVILERLTRHVFINKVPNKTAEATKEAIVASLKQLPDQACNSITYDNGGENYYHEEINDALNTTSYFCKPYHSWEKGAVENANGLIRRYIPKKTNLDTVTEKELKIIEEQINNRPRKCLGFKTPAEVFATQCAALAAA